MSQSAHAIAGGDGNRPSARVHLRYMGVKLQESAS
jgi:hypothetical protein